MLSPRGLQVLTIGTATDHASAGTVGNDSFATVVSPAQSTCPPVVEQSGRRAGVTRIGVIQQPAVGDRRGCVEAPTAVGANDCFRRLAGFLTATASAT
jgi:hypothetical protein